MKSFSGNNEAGCNGFKLETKTRPTSMRLREVGDPSMPSLLSKMNKEKSSMPRNTLLRFLLATIDPSLPLMVIRTFKWLKKPCTHDVCRDIRSFFVTNYLNPRQNETHVRLIPKVTTPRRVSDYRPIVLCTTHYKTIAKILTKRLQPILPQLISPFQSAFVPNRAISDNVLITHEILHLLQTSEAKKYCSMAVKMDMSKAYDRIEWGFFKAVLKKLCFNDKLVSWILTCVTSVSYSFLINGTPQGSVIPTRGLRQGDPLSSYLFILCTEMILCSFCKSNDVCCKNLLKILNTYEKASGQCINLNKSTLTFSSKTPAYIKVRVRSTLNISQEGGLGDYLGLPENFGHKKRDIFASNVDKIRQRAHSWSSRCLSGAGKQVHLQTVLTALPVYSMSCFKLPVSLCKQIQSVFTRFWWDDKADKRKMCWVAWDSLTQPKYAGGLGFRDVEQFNDALLAKIGWRLLNEPNSLLAKVLLNKYCNSSTFLTCSSSPRVASHGWRRILVGRDLLTKGLGWAVGDGATINVWNDPWLSLSQPKRPFGPPTEATAELKFPQQPTTDSFNWNKVIWNARLPPKLRKFLWKLVVGALAVGPNLAKRGLSETARCKRCGAFEDELHVFLHCSFAGDVWNLAPFTSQLNPLPLSTPQLLLQKLALLISLPPSGVTLTPLAPWILWNLWKARNLNLSEGHLFSANEVILKAIVDAKQWQNVQLEVPPQQSYLPPPVIPSPTTDAHVCFVDAAWYPITGNSGAGWIIEDASGLTIS
ncbi:PREDICTED: uncharacterized protein LOC104709936 [Camelina sativa]|uniref:Uncharacterized protein LOC104709936 n=1 Tax=Camelina sativa TaxID=90675 RepID=A0ABM0TDJ7_CAMSA|nr:PREDICTED: uncharacterized protein LOC104709936 [Camelina sativa]